MQTNSFLSLAITPQKLNQTRTTFCRSAEPESQERFKKICKPKQISKYCPPKDYLEFLSDSDFDTFEELLTDLDSELQQQNQMKTSFIEKQSTQDFTLYESQLLDHWRKEQSKETTNKSVFKAHSKKSRFLTKTHD